MAFASFDSKSPGAPMSEINMVPLIDVMLVLLVIFIVTAPLLTQAVKLDLPKATAQPNDLRPEKIEFAIDATGALFWNGEPVSRSVVQARFASEGRKRAAARSASARRPERGLPLRGADAGRRLQGRPDQGRLRQRARSRAMTTAAHRLTPRWRAKAMAKN